MDTKSVSVVVARDKKKNAAELARIEVLFSNIGLNQWQGKVIGHIRKRIRAGYDFLNSV